MTGFGQMPLFHWVPKLQFPMLPVTGSISLVVNWFVLPFLLLAIVGLSLSIYGIWQGHASKNNQKVWYAVLGLVFNLAPFVLWRFCFFVSVRE